MDENQLRSPTKIGHLSLSDSSTDNYLYVQGVPLKEVTANPTGISLLFLNKLKVGNTIYNMLSYTRLYKHTFNMSGQGMSGVAYVVSSRSTSYTGSNLSFLINDLEQKRVLNMSFQNTINHTEYFCVPGEYYPLSFLSLTTGTAAITHFDLTLWSASGSDTIVQL